MKIKKNQVKTQFVCLLLFSLFFSFFISPQDTFAKTYKTKKVSKHFEKSKKPRRSYNPEKTKQEALQILNSSNANYLVRLANGEIDESDLIIDSLIVDPGEDPIELEYEDDKPVDLDVFRTMYISYLESGDYDEIGGTLSSGISKRKIMEVILNWLGTPYYFGGTTNRGIDCSAFTRQIFYSSAKVLLPRTAREQYQVGIPVKREKLEFGDLVFFHTRRHTYISHVGIYLGDNLFAHSSSRFGVTVSSLESKYYSSRFIGARRLTQRDLAIFGRD